jgi:tRNA(Ile)-lysidine synthase
LRHGVLAQLESEFPGFVQCAGRSAAHCAQANTLLNDLAALDLERTGNPPAIARLQELGDERLANVLRYWLRGSSGAGPSTAQLHELMSQVRACRTRGHRIAIKVGAGQVQRQGEHLAYLPPI